MELPGVEYSGSIPGDWNLKKHVSFDHEKVKTEVGGAEAVVDEDETIHYWSELLPPAYLLPLEPGPLAYASPWPA